MRCRCSTAQDSHQTEQTFRNKTGETAYRPQYNIENVCRKREHSQESVGIVLKEYLRKKLTRKKDDKRRYNSVCRHAHSVVKRTEYGAVKKFGDKNTIYDKHDIVADKHCADKTIRVLVEVGNEFFGKVIAFTVHLCEHAIA